MKKDQDDFNDLLEVYIYCKFCQHLGGLDVDVSTVETEVYGSQNMIDKLKKEWDLLDKDSIKEELHKCLMIGFSECRD